MKSHRSTNDACTPNLIPRLQALQDKHHAIDNAILDYAKGPTAYYGDSRLKSLKLQKLRIKEEIESLQKAS